MNKTERHIIAKIQASAIGDYGKDVLPDLLAYSRRVKNFAYALYSAAEIDENEEADIRGLCSDLTHRIESSQ